MKNHFPLFVSSALLLALLGAMVFLDARPTHGHLYYPLDDTYIHMAISKNLAVHGVWGATPYHFASASSSILYTLVLGGSFWVFGVREIIPLALGIVSTLLVLIATHNWLRRLNVNPRMGLACQILLVLVVPLPATALLGMEHGFQLLSILLLAFYASGLISADVSPAPKQLAMLGLLAAMAEGFRFESAFLIAFLFVALLIRKRAMAALAVGFGGVLPVAIFGLISRQQGWPWLPTSVLLKGNTPHGGSLRALAATLGGTAIQRLSGEPLLLLLMIVTTLTFTLLLTRGLRWWAQIPVLLLSFLVTCFLHLQYASVGFFMRYEMYLVGFAIVANTVAASWLLQQSGGALGMTLKRLWAPVALLALLIGTPMIKRSFSGMKSYVQSGQDRWQIHIRPALFVKRYYNDSAVVVNDLGAMSFFTNAHVIDVYGLGDLTPVNLRHSPEGYNKATVENWIAQTGAPLAILQIDWVEVRDVIPDSWVKVGQIHADRNVVWGDLDVGFFSLQQASSDQLKRNIEEFDQAVPMY